MCLTQVSCEKVDLRQRSKKKFISAINNRYVKLLLMKRVLGILMEMILIFSHIFFNATQLSQDVVTFEIATTFTLFCCKMSFLDVLSQKRNVVSYYLHEMLTQKPKFHQLLRFQFVFYEFPQEYKRK